MKPHILQDVASMIHSYYRARGANLEATAKQVIEYVTEAYRKPDILQSSNVFQITDLNLQTFTWQQGDLLVTCSFDVVEVYEIFQSSHSKYLMDCLWMKLPVSHFQDEVTAKELLDQGAFVYLVRS